MYVISLIIAAVAGYGYQLTHGTCGIDDIAIDMYFEDGLGVAIGRWPFFYVNKLINVAEYQPFLMDFAAVLLLMLAAVLWSALIRSIVKIELPIMCYAVFSTMFMVYSLIAEVFIFYLHNGIAIIYCLVAVCLYGFYYLYVNRLDAKKKIGMNAIFAIQMCVAISFYESAANLYLFGALGVIFLDTVNENRLGTSQVKNAVRLMWYIVRILIYAIVGRSVVTTYTMQAFSIKEYFFRSVTSIGWLSSGDLKELYVNVIMLIKEIVKDYFAAGAVFYPILLFGLATILFLVFVFYKAICQKNIWIGIYGVATYLSLYVLTVIQCDTLKYRSCQMFSVFVAGVLMALTNVILKQRRWIKAIGMFSVLAIIYNSAKDLTHWFVLDYEKNQTELRVVNQIAYDIQSGGYDFASKPIVFVGDFSLKEELLDEYCVKKGENGFEIVDWAHTWMELTEDKYCFTQSLQSSLIDWAIEGLYAYGGYNKPLQNLFEYCGYSFIWGDSVLYEEVMPLYYYYEMEHEYAKIEAYGELEQFPYEGYIEETEDYIVIKL